jgi:glycosyltransferase involved in cell wall biosynthesis
MINSSGDYPLITIGLTSYFAEDTIGNAIDSALQQDWPNFEIVVVDDGSTDSSVEVIEQKCCKDSRVRLVKHEKNTGFAGALNTVIAEARGEFIAIFDDDDESLPQRIKEQYSRIVEYEASTGEKLIACWASFCKKYPNGYAFHSPAIGSQQKIPIGQDIVKYHLYLDRDADVFYGGGTPSCALMARRSTFLAVGPYDINLRRNEDSDFAIRLGLLGGHFIGTTQELVVQSASDGKDKKPEVARQSDHNFIAKYKDILQSHGRYQYAAQWVDVRYYHYSGNSVQACFQIAKMALRHPVLTLRRVFKAGPRRLLHERKMRKGL